jgi:hypothetical protein
MFLDIAKDVLDLELLLLIALGALQMYLAFGAGGEQCPGSGIPGLLQPLALDLPGAGRAFHPGGGAAALGIFPVFVHLF